MWASTRRTENRAICPGCLTACGQRSLGERRKTIEYIEPGGEVNVSAGNGSVEFIPLMSHLGPGTPAAKPALTLFA